ncbi:unnamed protein product [Amoebophrya sp. A25]|nr:unnamed protein product [Amoebophrya sp. A25]|eukprot:GSA25T00025245001.1
MTEQQPQMQEVAYDQVQQGPYYGAFMTTDGYNVPPGVFHTGATVQIPGQSFVGPPMGLDGQPLLQLPGAGQAGIQAQPLMIGIPGGFHFAPEYNDVPEPTMAPAVDTGYNPGYSSPYAYDPASITTRDAVVTKKKAGGSAWCKCFAKN